MRWYVVKNEWGYWGSDLPPFDNFQEACEAAAAHCHLNVISESLFKEVESLPRVKKPRYGDELPETD